MRRLFLFSIVICFIIGLSSSTINAQINDKKAVSLELAKKIVAAAEAEAVKNKWTVVISIVDDGGHLVYLQRMDNTQLGSIEVSIAKAKTAIFFKRPTKTYEDRVAGGNNAILSLPNVLPFDGGLPLIFDGHYIGAIGVSGGSSQQDGIVAKAGADLLTSK